MILGNITSISHDDPTLPYDPSAYQYTLVLDDLISQGEEDLGSGISTIRFAGGTLAIYQDAGTASDWSEPHLEGVPPPSFVDGELWAGGALSVIRFDLFRAVGQGAFEARIELTEGPAQAWFPGSQEISGTLIPGLCTFQETSYDLSLDGEIQAIETTVAATRTLGAIKALY